MKARAVMSTVMAAKVAVAAIAARAAEKPLLVGIT